MQEGERKREMRGRGKRKVLVFNVDQTPNCFFPQLSSPTPRLRTRQRAVRNMGSQNSTACFLSAALIS